MKTGTRGTERHLTTSRKGPQTVKTGKLNSIHQNMLYTQKIEVKQMYMSAEKYIFHRHMARHFNLIVQRDELKLNFY